MLGEENVKGVKLFIERWIRKRKSVKENMKGKKNRKESETKKDFFLRFGLCRGRMTANNMKKSIKKIQKVKKQTYDAWLMLSE